MPEIKLVLGISFTYQPWPKGGIGIFQPDPRSFALVNLTVGSIRNCVQYH